MIIDVTEQKIATGMRLIIRLAIFRNSSLKASNRALNIAEKCPIMPVAIPQRTARTISWGMSSFRNGLTTLDGTMLMRMSFTERDAEEEAEEAVAETDSASAA